MREKKALHTNKHLNAQTQWMHRIYLLARIKRKRIVSAFSLHFFYHRSFLACLLVFFLLVDAFSFFSTLPLCFTLVVVKSTFQTANIFTLKYFSVLWIALGWWLFFVWYQLGFYRWIFVTSQRYAVNAKKKWKKNYALFSNMKHTQKKKKARKIAVGSAMYLSYTCKSYKKKEFRWKTYLYDIMQNIFWIYKHFTHSANGTIIYNLVLNFCSFN